MLYNDNTPSMIQNFLVPSNQRVSRPARQQLKTLRDEKALAERKLHDTQDLADTALDGLLGLDIHRQMNGRHASELAHAQMMDIQITAGLAMNSVVRKYANRD